MIQGPYCVSRGGQSLHPPIKSKINEYHQKSLKDANQTIFETCITRWCQSPGATLLHRLEHIFQLLNFVIKTCRVSLLSLPDFRLQHIVVAPL
jgi:hypothetical protein